jgi:hypothetical protein
LARLGAVLGTAVAANALISGPAGASTPEVYGGSSSGNALNLSIAGNNLTGGLSVANVKSSLAADSEGAGIFTPGQVQDLKTSVNGNNQSQTKPHACLQSLPPSVPLLGLSIACSSSTSSVTNNLPNADATGLIAHLTLGNLGQLSPQFSQGLSQLADGLKQIPQLGPILSQAVNSAGSGSILDAQIGPSESNIATNANAMTSKANAQGSIINLFSVPNVTPGTTGSTAAAAAPSVSVNPLIKIIVGDADASATYDRHTGKSSGTNHAALVTVSLNFPGQQPQTFSVVPGVDQSIPPAGQGPTVVSLKVGTGKTTTNPDGSVSSVADALSIAVLPGQAPGGKDVLDLQLAHAQAAAGGAPATVTAPHPPTLPFTGEHPWIPYAGLGFLGGAMGLGFLAYRGGFRFGFRRS